MNRYPDASAGRLRTALSAALDVPVEDIATGTGSVAVLGQSCGQHATPATRSCTHGARSRPIPSSPVSPTPARWQYPAIPTEGTGSTRWPRRSTRACESSCSAPRTIRPAPRSRTPTLSGSSCGCPAKSWFLVVVDEAYAEFVTDPAVANGLALYRSHPNVAVLRTFSKAYGLAGLRVGYAVAHEPVAAALRKTAVTFGVSTLAEAGPSPVSTLTLSCSNE